jgi:hypothetical protein
MPCFADAVNLPATVGIAFRGSACDWVALFVVAVVIFIFACGRIKPRINAIYLPATMGIC